MNNWVFHNNLAKVVTPSALDPSFLCPFYDPLFFTPCTDQLSVVETRVETLNFSYLLRNEQGTLQ